VDAFVAPLILMDEDKVEASFNNGVLKVSLPKRPEAIGKQRTIPIKKG
jgi:HSP20 family protein